MGTYRVFFQEFFRNYHTTGAIAPSGKRLAKALCRQVRANDRPRRILEVGPGTGAVTQELVQRIQPGDTLHLVELNSSFVEVLKNRLKDEPNFQKVAQQTQILACPVQELSPEAPYDCIISGLPLNNFEVDVVAAILNKLQELSAQGGTLSFFQYIAIRKMKALVTSGQQRARLKGIGGLLDDLFRKYEFKRDRVWLNLPPAYVHHLQFTR